MLKKIGLSLLALCFACSHLPVEKVPETASQVQEAGLITVAVVGMNDFHGSLLPRERKLPDGSMVRSGGASVLASMIARLKQEMQGRVLVVDAGDEWQGTLESNSVKGATVVEFFNRLGVQVAAIGNHEFDFNLDQMKQRFSEAHYPYVASNIREKKTKKAVQWGNVRPSVLLEVAGIKIGVIGVSTEQTPSTTRYETVKHLDFIDPVAGVEAESKRLKSLGAEAVLVTAHAGTECKDEPSLRSWNIWDQKSVQGSCDADKEIHRLASRVAEGTLHGIVAGHTHQVIHHFLSGIPTIQGEAYNQYFNILYLTFDRATGAIRSDLTRIEGLIPICSEVFQGTRHCDARRLQAGLSPKLEPATFHGAVITPDPSTEAWLKPIRESTDRFRNEVLGETELPLTQFRDREGAFPNLIADVLREKGKADFSLVNSGGVRTSLDAGPVTFDGVFRALPFDNLLRVVELSGEEVKLLYRIASSGAHGVIGVSGLQLEIRDLKEEAPRTDLNGDGKFETWETNRLLQIRTSEGREIEPSKRYRVATFDFLLNGGDDLAWFMGRIPTRMISPQYSGYCRDLVSDYLKREKRINTKSKPLVDPAHPRLIFKSERPSKP